MSVGGEGVRRYGFGLGERESIKGARKKRKKRKEETQVGYLK